MLFVWAPAARAMTKMRHSAGEQGGQHKYMVRQQELTSCHWDA
jgi:hypothetical protein